MGADGDPAAALCTLPRVDVRLTIAIPGASVPGVDVLVSAQAPVPLATVRPLLAKLLADASIATAEAWCNGMRVDDAAVGLPPLVQAAVVAFGDHSAATQSVAASGLALGVSRGPDAGRILALPPGRSVIGRGPDADLRLTDPEVSRAHAALTVLDDAVTLDDLGSTNGSRVHADPGSTDPATAPAEPASVGPTSVPQGGRITIGGTDLVLRRVDTTEPASTTPDSAGYLLLNRISRLRPPQPCIRLAYPPSTSTPAANPPAWLLLLLPVLVAVPLAAIWHQPAFLILALASPVAAIGQYLLERRQSRRRRRTCLADEVRARASVDASAARALAEQRHRSEADHPDLSQVLLAATVPTTSVWERRHEDADALVVRIGRGALASQVWVTEATGVAEALVLPDAPVTVDLRQHRVLGVCGPRPVALGLARAVIGQLAVHLSPGDLSIDVLTAPQSRDDWRWVRWLPHTGTCLPGQPSRRTRLVVLDGAAVLRRRPDVLALLGAGDTVCLCLDSTRGALPAECAAVVVTRPDRHLDLHLAEQETLREVRAETGGPAWAEAVARALAPLRDATPTAANGLPVTVDLVQTIRAGSSVHGVPGVDPMSAAGLAELWSRNGRSSAAVLGARDDGEPWVVDLARDGPHVLVAGTTGAGKSALLRSWVVALAAANRPDALTFVLVDYKGGAAFAGCADLPHVSGVVTDLDEVSTRRALRSLQAELRRRERLLKDAGMSDADQYAAAAEAASLPPLARLVLIVDEFAVLSEDLPDFVSGLVRIAAVGRSLGVHLILATQRPGGVVSADIRANMSLRVALRVREQTDSLDVIDAPDAAGLPPSSPGRAVVRGGDGALVHVQVAHCRARLARGDAGSPAAHSCAADAAGEVRVCLPDAEDHDRPTAEGSPAPSPSEVAGSRADPLQIIAAAMKRATDRLGITVPPPPWLPALPARLEWSALASDGPAQDEEAGAGNRDVTIGLVDLPGLQAQRAWRWRLDERANLAVIGGPRSGRTTTARTIAMACAASAMVYVVDSTGALADLQRYPHVGAVVPCQDLERSNRLLDLLTEIVTRRRRAPGSAPAPAALPAAATATADGDANADGDVPVVLLLDGWEAVAEAWAPTRLQERLVGLLRDGPAVRVLAAITGGRSLLTTGVAAVVPNRLLLRLADPVEATLAGVRPRDVPTEQPPGRALQVSAGEGVHHIQIALPPPGPIDGQRSLSARPVPALPSQILARDLVHLHPDPAKIKNGGVVEVGPSTSNPSAPSSVAPSRVAPSPTAPSPVAVGAVAFDRLAALAVPVSPPGLLVVGGPGSGRSSALQTICAAVRGCGRCVVVLSPQEDTAHASALLAAAPADAVAVVDDAGRLDPGLDDVLARHAGGGRQGGAVVAACSAGEVALSFRGVLALLRPARRAVVLGPIPPSEMDWLGVRPPVPAASIPGRGWLVDRGRLTAIHLAVTPDGVQG